MKRGFLKCLKCQAEKHYSYFSRGSSECKACVYTARRKAGISLRADLKADHPVITKFLVGA